jgi:nucleoside-diphosphate-sugar epimerase
VKKILVTGATGYLGSVLTGYLNENGYESIGLDTGFFKDGLLFKPDTQTRIIAKDARQINRDDLRGVFAVVHLAGISNDPVGKFDAHKLYDITRDYTKSIAKLCKELGVKFIFASSCSVYGIGSDLESNENSTVNPQTLYSLNKVQIEDDLAQLSSEDFSPIALRFATAFGPSPRQRFDIVINMLVGSALATGKIVLNSDGKAWRPNVHVLDICESIKCSLDLDYREPELLILNVGADENNHRIIDLAEIVQRHVPGSEIKFLFDNPDLDPTGLMRDRKISTGTDNRTYKVSFEKIKIRMPLYKGQWNIDKGVKNFVSILNELKFTDEFFTKKEFYRLQKLEQLLDFNSLDHMLYWR